MKSTAMLALMVAALAAPVRASAQDPAADDFERSALGASWTRYGGSMAQIIGGSDLGTPDASRWCFVGWTQSVFDADQYSEAALAVSVPSYMLMQVYVRRRASDGARYAFHYNGDPGTARWEIKYDGVPTADTRLLATLADPSGPSPGDTLRIEAVGSDPVVIRGYHEGVLLLEAMDGAPQRITATGPAGVVSRQQVGGTVTSPAAIFASWSGGSLVGVSMDAGVAMDSGVGDGGVVDGGSTDSGVSSDGGATDSATSGDAATADTSVPPVDAAGDAIGADTGAVDGGGGESDGGCSIAARAPMSPLAWLLLGPIAWWRRRRRSRKPLTVDARLVTNRRVLAATRVECSTAEQRYSRPEAHAT